MVSTNIKTTQVGDGEEMYVFEATQRIVYNTKKPRFSNKRFRAALRRSTKALNWRRGPLSISRSMAHSLRARSTHLLPKPSLKRKGL